MARMALIALVCLAMTLPAAADLVENGSFEFGPDLDGHTLVSLDAGSTQIPGWTVLGFGVKSIDYIGPDCWDASDGEYSLDLNGLQNTGGVEQVISTVPGYTYLVTFDMAGNYVPTPPIKTMEVSASGSSTPAGPFSFDVAGKTPTSMGWTPKQWTFVAGAGSTTTLRFLSMVTGDDNDSWGPALDNVSVNVVPAPAAVLLGLLGLGAAGIRLRRFA